MESLIPLIMPFIEKYPIIASILMIVGTLRVINKPLFTFLDVVVAATESNKDNEIVNKIKESKGYKAFCFVLDYLASVKLIK